MTFQKAQDFSFSNLVDKNKIKYNRNKPLLILDLDEVVSIYREELFDIVWSVPKENLSKFLDKSTVLVLSKSLNSV